MHCNPLNNKALPPNTGSSRKLLPFEGFGANNKNVIFLDLHLINHSILALLDLENSALDYMDKR